MVQLWFNDGSKDITSSRRDTTNNSRDIASSNRIIGIGMDKLQKSNIEKHMQNDF